MISSRIVDIHQLAQPKMSFLLETIDDNNPLSNLTEKDTDILQIKVSDDEDYVIIFNKLD